MSCPHCGTDISPRGGKCPACSRAADDAAAVTVLTPLPAPAPPQATPAHAGLQDLELTYAAHHFDAQTFLGDAPSPAAAASPAPAAGHEHDTGPLNVGQAFSARYHIIKVLGIGGMGAVYHAWDADLGVAVALKVIRPEATRDPETAREMERRFKQELVLARQVTHKNVVRIHDMGEIDGIKYITMPWLQGEDLATILRRDGRLDVRSALRIVRDVAAGLAAAHEAGIVHRDLKPANIMVLKDVAIIMDFGIARAAGSSLPETHVTLAPAGFEGTVRTESTVVGTILGTVQYMAPEQARGQNADQRADIYALGLIFLDALLGKRHKTGSDDSAFDELKRRMEKAPPLARSVDPSIPEGVEQFIARCVQPDPAARFQSSADMVAALDLLDEDGAAIRVRRVVGLPLLTAVILLLLALTAGTWWYQRQLIPDAPHDPVKLIIADVRNGTNDPAFDNSLPQVLRRGLEDASFINAFDRSRIPSLGIEPPERLDETAARELAVKQGADVVLSGAIERQGSGYALSVKAVEAISGNVIAEEREVARTADRVLQAALTVMARVRSALGDETSESAQLFAMRSVSASSLAVVGHYAAAVEAQAGGRFEDARQSYQKAVDLDPTFGLGYQGLAATTRNLGQLDESDRYINEALRYIDGMTARERLATRGFYYRLKGDNRKCADEYGALLASYPADSVARNQRAVCLAKLRDMRGATNEMRQAVKMLPRHAGYRTNLALMTSLSGEFQAVAAEVNEIEQPDARALLALAYSQIAMGLPAEAANTYRKMSTMGAAGASYGASGLGDLAMFQGRFAEAARIFEEGAAAELAAKSPDRAAIKLTSLGHAHLAAGRKAAAIAAADRALTHSKGMPVRFLAARIYAEAGAFDKAQALAAPMSMELAAEPQAHGKIVEGQIALLRGDAREAIKLLTEANGLLDTWFGHFDLGRAYLQAGALTEADSEFDRCVVRRGEALSLMDEGPTYGHFPIVYYHLGRVREAMKTANYADAYREYLKIRGESPDDPLLDEIRRRIGA
jgi:serine/threonine protein kinase/tetratricopeptide (TPR) repeat protein